MKRCGWSEGSELEMLYHDTEWGVPEHDDRRLFEFLILEGMQAGLSWSTILKKRDRLRQAYGNFEPERVVRFNEDKVRELLTDPGVIRNRLKIESTIKNARAFLLVQEEFGAFDAYIWRFVEGRTIQNRWSRPEDIPAQTADSESMSKELRKRGFSFVGPTICYAFMQAVGMVNDHLADCFRHEEVTRLGSTRLSP